MIEQHLMITSKELYQKQLKDTIEQVLAFSFSHHNENTIGILLEKFSGRYEEIRSLIAEILTEKQIDFKVDKCSKIFRFTQTKEKFGSIRFLSALNPGGLRGIGFTDLIVIYCDDTKLFHSYEFQRTIVPVMECRVNTSITYVHDYTVNDKPTLIVSSKNNFPIP